MFATWHSIAADRISNTCDKRHTGKQTSKPNKQTVQTSNRIEAPRLSQQPAYERILLACYKRVILAFQFRF